MTHEPNGRARVESYEDRKTVLNGTDCRASGAVGAGGVLANGLTEEIVRIKLDIGGKLVKGIDIPPGCECRGGGLQPPWQLESKPITKDVKNPQSSKRRLKGSSTAPIAIHAHTGCADTGFSLLRKRKRSWELYCDKPGHLSKAFKSH